MSGIDPLFQNESFDDETLEMMSAALESAWTELEIRHRLSSNPSTAAKARELVAKRIIVLARAGERSQEKFRRGALVVVTPSAGRTRG